MNSESIDKNLLKEVFEEMLRERNPDLKGLLEELLTSFLTGQATTDRVSSLDMVDIRKKYALRHELFEPLQEIFQDAPPAKEMLLKLRK